MPPGGGVASMPPGHCLGTLIEVPFTKEKMPWCPCPLSKTKHTCLQLLHAVIVFMGICTPSLAKVCVTEVCAI